MTFNSLDHVSRETSERLDAYIELVQKWSPKINLVSKESLPQIRERHIKDSLETASCAPSSPGSWLDLGSGGGFPGIVAAIVMASQSPATRVTLVESDQRKCVFLRTVIREIELNARVINQRIEAVPPENADVVSARALAPLDQLLAYCAPHIHRDSLLILPKGVRWKQECAEAKQKFSFSLDVRPSVTQEGSVNLLIRDLARA